MTIVNVTEARAKLPELIAEVEAGAEIVLTRHGKEVAVLVRPDLLRIRRRSELFEDAARLRRRMEQARNEPLRQGPGISPERADELVAQLRAERDQW